MFEQTDPSTQIDASILDKPSKNENLSIVNSLLEKLSDGNTNTVVTALGRISVMDKDSQKLFIPKIIALTLNQSKAIRYSALTTLGDMKSTDKVVLFAIKKCLFDKESDIRRCATDALSRMGSLAEHAIYELADRIVNDRDPIVQELCCYALAELGPNAHPALPALSQTLRYGTEATRVAAARTISRIGPEAEMLRPALIQALQDHNHHVRYFASEALTLMHVA